MEIRINNRLPEGMKLELFVEFMPIVKALKEEGIDELVQPFYDRLLNEKHPELEGQSWHAWEGYYSDQEDGSQNLYTMGVLQDRGIYYSRLMRIKNVPRAQQTETEKALADMMLEYMQGLFKEIARTIKPGSGKTENLIAFPMPIDDNNGHANHP